ncbi:NUDIX hydrolase [Archangium violaceum]|uniref:NUDIX hydrolase n=1 Tax=Archangium violaceum TaxID=83451 RepID=UPI00194DF124|nr:NUDIX hydrolase [Archangium violaceum]QRN98563.1 NUDIX hydrolase [Archangium violaceum]
MRLPLVLLLTLTTTVSAAPRPQVPAGYWPESRVEELLAKTETIRLAPDLSRLTPEEQRAVKDLLEVGGILQRIYEESRHPEALEAYARLTRMDQQTGGAKRTRDLLTLYRLSQGPIATTLDNKREAFLPVAAELPTRNVYPSDLTREEVEAFLAQHPETRDELLGERTVVRRATKASLAGDLAALAKYPALALLHPRLSPNLKSLAKKPDPKTLYAVPYPVAYANDFVRAYELLMSAADSVEKGDGELARYLRNRARDLLSNDYESGDAAWVTGRFQRLNAQIGSYETYDDALFGVKAFHGMSLLLANEEATRELRRALSGLQAIEDALPYASHKRIREDIPVGIYEVIADFGQARGTNTATILPNDALFAHRYGRTILLRENIMKNPDIFAADARVWRAVTADAHASDLAAEGNFQRTLWHEIGHYLGVDRDARGRALDVALEDYADALEEMKADLASLFALHAMNKGGTVSDATLRAVRASGIRRTLQNAKPRRDQPYQTMQLIQFNWFLEHGLLQADPKTARLTIHYERYLEVVTSLLKEVLAVQHAGDKAAAARFFERWGTWTPELHDVLAARVREAQGARFRIVHYSALGE